MNRKEWLFIAIATFITVCAWAIFDILHTRSNVDISPKVQELIEPIEPEFDQEAIKSLE